MKIIIVTKEFTLAFDKTEEEFTEIKENINECDFTEINDILMPSVNILFCGEFNKFYKGVKYANSLVTGVEDKVENEEEEMRYSSKALGSMMIEILKKYNCK